MKTQRLKREWMPKLGYPTVWVAKKDIGDYLKRYYNKIRPHSYNLGMSPVSAENMSN